MLDSILRIARDAALILLAVEGLVFSVAALVLVSKGLRQVNRVRPKVRPAVHKAAEAVLRVSAGAHQVSQRMTNTTAAVRGAPSGLLAGVRSVLRGRQKETTRE